MPNPQTTFHQTTFHGPSTLSRRRDTIGRATVQTQLGQLRSTGRYDCFELGWKRVYEDKSNWPVPPHLFWDSDLGKWIEGACYFLRERQDAEVDGAVRDMVRSIGSAQRDDGYLNLHYMLVEPEGRWSNLQDMHELYNAGHLIEAALAHRDHYGTDELLAPMLKYVALIRKTFGRADGQRRGYPGHPEIELALLRLYRATGSQDAYELARFFLEERGNPTGQEGTHYYLWEAARRGESLWTRPNPNPVQRDQSLWYCQAHAPITEQKSVEGHAVRAMYLLTAAADLLCIDKEARASAAAALASASAPASASESQSEPDTKREAQEQQQQQRQRQQLPPASKAAWTDAVTRLWDNMVDKKMYLTGGIGAIKQWEGFGADYFLPQGTDEGGCYAETCASIGAMFLAERMLALDLDARYADVMELCLYNGVMTAMSLDGRAFTYVNQLASSDEDLSRREDWFECSCCPPNLTRLFGSLGGYLWHYQSEAKGEASINVFMYTTARLAFEVDGGHPVTLEQESNYPWEGRIQFHLAAPDVKTTIRLRIPSWSRGAFTLSPPDPAATRPNKGFLELGPAYLAAHPSFALELGNFAPRYVAPHPYTNQNTLALARGPIVYCVEDVDNAWETNHFKDIGLRAGTPVATEQAALDGEAYVALRTKGWERSLEGWEARDAGGDPGASLGPLSFGVERELVFVPYYFRANRGWKGHMRVGLLRA